MKKILIHLGLILLTSFVIIWAAMMWLDIWTRHGDTITVPSVKLHPYATAAMELNDQGLVALLADSVYDRNTAPGTVIDQNPKAGTVVKEGREVYLTINALSPKMITLPSLTDISVRQARSILEGLELRNITETRVPSDYKDLVLAVLYKGRRLSPGARVPISATIELEVGEGAPEIVLDSLGFDVEEQARAEQLELFN